MKAGLAMIKWPDIDFKRLLALNPETIGWLHLEGTPIDYPVVRGRGDDHYLKHNFTGEESPHGCIFAVHGDTFPGNRSTLFGHNMKDNSMFSHLLFYYHEEGFIDKHPVIKLKTPDADYEIRVWSTMHFPNGYEVAAYPPTEKRAFAKWKRAIIRLCPFGSTFKLRCEDDIMVFCTCRPHINCKLDGTMIVIGKVCKTNALPELTEKTAIFKKA